MDAACATCTAHAEVLDGERVMATSADDAKGEAIVDLPKAIEPWSPEHPHVYRLRLTVRDAKGVTDVRESPWGLREFRTEAKRFMLNGAPVEMRGGTVVWHRFLRNPEAKDVAWDAAWFEKNIVKPLKMYGANTLRFHLGSPPEELLDLCDRDGLLVQLEWPLFHGIKASDESLRTQWTAWLDLAMRHPSVAIVHAWNETSGPDLEVGWHALNAVLTQYPPMVVAHRDTLHIHKYWWSLFENLGLYYDSYDQFPKTIMVDEFGGNYLDAKGNAGSYPTTKDSFLRFLGREQTKAMRLEFHAEANARVAEYWRRIGAAGELPFCILGSPDDGNSWFLGPLRDPQPMPVWDAMAAAWSPRSVSLDVWDRNFLPGQKVTVPLYFFNEENSGSKLTADVRVVAADGRVLSSQRVERQISAHGREHTMVSLTMPATVGDWRLEARLAGDLQGPEAHAVSAWDVRTMLPAHVPPMTVAIPEGETELQAFAKQNGLRTVGLEDHADVVLLGATAWQRMEKDVALRSTLEKLVDRGESVVMLDAGPRDLGLGYAKGDMGPLEGAPRVREPYVRVNDVFGGVKVTFHQMAEPESNVQSAAHDDSLWTNMPHSATWLWDGMRGGLIAPAADMDVSGLSRKAFVAQWTARGADASRITASSYSAFELAGYYAFSDKPHDKAAIAALRRKVTLLAEDAPALQDVVNPKSHVEETDLAEGYRSAGESGAEKLTVLATAGKGLVRTPVVELGFGAGKGHVIVSQLLTAGRLVRGAAEPGEYGVRYDPAAEQMVLNMLVRVTKGE